MAQALLLTSGVATPCPRAPHLVCSPSQGNVSTASASVLSRSEFVSGKQLLHGSGDLLRSRGGGVRRSRLVDVGVLEADTAGTAAKSSSSGNATFPWSSEIQKSDSPSPFSGVLDDLRRSLTGFEETGPELTVPETSSSTALPSVDSTVTQTPPVESAVISSPGVVDSAGVGSDVVQGAGDSVGDSAGLTRLQRYKDLIDRATGGGGAKKPVAVEEDVTSLPLPNSIDAAQESAANSVTDIQESASKTVTDIQESAANSVTDIQESAAKTVTDIQESAANSVTDIQESATKSVTDIQDSINDSVGSASEGIRDVFENINGSIKGSVDSVTGSIKGSADLVTGSIKGSVDSVIGLFNKTLEDIQSSVGGSVSKAGGGVAGLTSIFRSGTPLNNQLKEVVVVVKGATGTVLEAAGNVLTGVYGTARGSLPSEVQSSLSIVEQKVHEISDPLGSFLQQAYGALEEVERAIGVDPDNPIIPVFFVVGGTLYLGVSFWQGRYGGYSGDLMPISAFDLLKKERNAVLVDIRPQELRESEGVPDLRRGLRSRSASVETITVDSSLRSRLKNAKEIDCLLTSSVIRNLKTVSPGTKVIVMDDDGSQSKEIARTLRRFGVRRRYRVEGGYKAWAAAGLRTKLGGTDNPLSILREDAAEIVEEVKPTPVAVVLTVLGLGVAIYAAIEWEKSLQIIGVIGIGQAIFGRARSYESLEDVKADLSLLLKPFRSIGDAILWVVGQVKPGTLQLATSPSTSAVRDRVVQAAAKHGPLASELVEEDKSKDESEDESEAEVQTSSEISASTATAEAGPVDSSPPTASE